MRRARRPVERRGSAILLAAVAVSAWSGSAPLPAAAPRLPNVVVVTIDTLRADRLSAAGYARPTTPAIDRLMAGGVRFSEARTVEPLTAPALASLWTSLEPHRHGATRNGLRMKRGLSSLPELLGRSGFRTAAFVGSWTLRDKLCGLGGHFDEYVEVLDRKRWLGLLKAEATGEDLTREAIAWMERRKAAGGRRPFLLWVHYVEPHAPYRLQREFANRLGLPRSDATSRSDRYDTEIAFVDDQVGRLLSALERIEGDDNLVLLTSDHGESLGEHDYWGHGRNLYDPTVRIPMGLSWPGRIPAARTIPAPALITDLTPTVLGLLDLPVPSHLAGFDWSGTLTLGTPPPETRVMKFQAHRGAVLSQGGGRDVHLGGLLEVAILEREVKEIFRLAGARRLFDLRSDPREERSLAPLGTKPSPALATWLAQVRTDLTELGDRVESELDEESSRRLRALGYLD